MRSPGFLTGWPTNTKKMAEIVAEIVVGISSYKKEGSIKTRNVKIGKVLQTSSGFRVLLDPIFLQPAVVNEHRIAMREGNTLAGDSARPTSGPVSASLMTPKGILWAPGSAATGPHPAEEVALDMDDSIPF